MSAAEQDVVHVTGLCLAAVAARGVMVHTLVRTWPEASAVAALDVGGILP